MRISLEIAGLSARFGAIGIGMIPARAAGEATADWAGEREKNRGRAGDFKANKCSRR